MTYTETDPKIVREIARTAFRGAIRQCRNVAVSAAVYDSSPVSLSESFFIAYRDAVAAEYDRLAAALSWPDEQQAASYPGIPGDCWRDSEGDVWVLCGDGMMRLLYTDPMPWDPDGLPGEYGPMEPVGQAAVEVDGDVPCFWCHCDGCDECTGICGVVCGCRNPVQR